MPHEFQRDQLSDFSDGLFPGLTFYILKGEENHRILPLVPGIVISALPNQLVPEIDGSIFPGFFKENTEHIHVHAFAKTPGPGKQGDHGLRVQKIPNQQCLVHIVVIRGRCLEIGDADGQGLFLFSST